MNPMTECFPIKKVPARTIIQSQNILRIQRTLLYTILERKSHQDLSEPLVVLFRTLRQSVRITKIVKELEPHIHSKNPRETLFPKNVHFQGKECQNQMSEGIFDMFLWEKSMTVLCRTLQQCFPPKKWTGKITLESQNPNLTKEPLKNPVGSNSDQSKTGKSSNL